MDFVSSPSSTNKVNTAYEVSTANTQVSPASTQVSTASTQVSTANLSDDTVYAFLASQLNGSQLVYEDLEQIHEDDIKEMDLKCHGGLLMEMVLTELYGRLMSSTNMDLMAFSDSEEFQQPEFESYGPKSVSEDISNEVRESLDALLVEKLVLDDKSQSPRGNQRNWNNQKSQQLGSDFVMYNKACFVCGSFDHVQANCNYHQRERVVSRNNYTRVNYNYSAKKAYPSAHKNIVPRAVLMKSGLKSLNTARPVNTSHPKTTVYSARPMSHFSKSAQSTVKRPYQIRTTLTNKNTSKKVYTAKGKFYTARPKAVNTAKPNSTVVNAMRANQVNTVKALTCWVWRSTKLNSASIL
ncbi:hypothetical protein Tco_0309729 [Tanacetum coccineum]